MKQWDEIHILVCQIIAQRSTCAKVQVGAVLAMENRIISIGYNGVAPGQIHCNEIFDVEMFKQLKDYQDNGTFNGAHAMGLQQEAEDHTAFQKENEIHAEANCLLWAARKGVETEGATLYCTMSPCNDCSKLIIAAGVERVVYLELYDKETKGLELMEKVGIEVIPFMEENE